MAGAPKQQIRCPRGSNLAGGAWRQQPGLELGESGPEGGRAREKNSAREEAGRLRESAGSEGQVSEVGEADRVGRPWVAMAWWSSTDHRDTIIILQTAEDGRPLSSRAVHRRPRKRDPPRAPAARGPGRLSESVWKVRLRSKERGRPPDADPDARAAAPRPG